MLNTNHAAAVEGAREATRSDGSFDGDLACLSAFELLQVFQYLGKEGRLLLRGSGREASCDVFPRGLARLECGNLRGLEAGLAFVWWQEGRFHFEARASHRQTNPDELLAVQELLLEAVRLADEIEAHGELVPDREEPLETPSGSTLPLEWEALPSAREIVRFLAAWPSATRRDFERVLPYSPVTLGLATARLCEAGLVARSVELVASETAGVTPQEPDSTREESGRIVRALFAFDPHFSEEIPDALARLQESLGAPISRTASDLAAPSFLRTRLPSGCFVSITVLPISRRNRFVLESLAPSLGLVVLVVGDRIRDEIERWRRHCPSNVQVVLARSPKVAVTEAVATIRRLERATKSDFDE